ncbi:MAG: peptidylprolyl isomerase [Deltaproteobacteria bacterium]|nr:MAG: peptidylprolyl isomerase [Deltaproteobacteria bacterium]
MTHPFFYPIIFLNISKIYNFLTIRKGEVLMKKSFKKLVIMIIMSLALLSFGFLSIAAEKEIKNKKVAEVNGVVITQTEFDREFQDVKQRLIRMGKSVNKSNLQQIKKNVLEKLIGLELLYQESQKEGFKVDKAKVSEEFDKIKKRFKNEADFKNILSRLGYTEISLKKQIKREIAIHQFIEEKFVKKITILDKDLKAYYDSHKELFKQPEQVRARHILIKVSPQANAEEKALALKKIEEVQKKVKKGEDFATLAKEYSQGPSSTKGGDLGYFKRGQMVKPFEDVAFSLKPGEVSDIVKTRFGYHLIKVIDKKPETIIAYNKIKEKLSEFLKQRKVQKEVTDYVEELKKKAKVKRFLSEIEHS